MHHLKTIFASFLLLAGFTAFAQQIEVTGVVTSGADGYVRSHRGRRHGERNDEWRDDRF